MAHGLNHQHAWHNRLFGEMSCEERLVAGNILYAHNRLAANAYDFVNQLHGVAMRQHLAYAVYVEHRFHCRVIYRSLNLMLAYLLAHRACELIIYSVSGTRCNYAAFERLAYQSHISDDVQQLMTGTLILPGQRLVLQVTEFCSIHVRYLEIVTEAVNDLLLLFQLIDYYCVVKVSALYQAGFQQRYDVSDEHECAGRGNLF